MYKNLCKWLRKLKLKCKCSCMSSKCELEVDNNNIDNAVDKQISSDLNYCSNL